MKRILAIVLVVMLAASIDAVACTAAIFTGKLTPDGRPLMWKHRDNPKDEVCLEYIDGDRYSFIALMNSSRKSKSAWGGTNEAGFCIINTLSYNLNYDKVKYGKFPDGENVMYRALSRCKDLADFEKLLDEYKNTRNESNFGVVDAYGGAAFYEVSATGWTKIDVNDPKVAPQGYLVYANHSYTGKLDDGQGYIRYTNADHIVKTHLGRAGEFTPKWIFQNLSRSFYHSLLDIDLVKDTEITERGTGWFIAQDFIPRNSSTSVMVFAGVKPGEDPLNTVMWTILGYPPVSVAVPMLVKAGINQPAWMTPTPDSPNALMCMMALDLKKEVFAIERGNGKQYMNFAKMYNRDGTGYMQLLRPLEERIFELAGKFLAQQESKEYNRAQFEDFYEEVFKDIESVYCVIGK